MAEIFSANSTASFTETEASQLFELSQTEWFPVRVVRQDFPDVPEAIASAATEATAALSSGLNRAAVLLARSVVEATAKDQGVTSGNLASKIDTMCEKRLIREHIRAGAHEIRYLGNDMAHGDFVVEVPAEDAELVVTLMSEVLDEVYQSPARVKKATDARQARKGG
ncbi:hypothetical protein JOJ86_001479 [Rhodococcus percolatus]|uniref:DUF4145 domain-containing protein n=1 Tax=Rhodococcus opacus TaxID=37919 RepID=UPI0017F1799E|nr:DUF4145 domain-containing protein [Rhodococcus opacus]MBA8958188.1 hypothetical protein [Rhodococcus opacus]MBP2203753.1 hypothetical protein [Rhodococcus opacus]